MVCLSVILLCYRITCLWFCNKRFYNKKGMLFVLDPVFLLYKVFAVSQHWRKSWKPQSCFWCLFVFTPPYRQVYLSRRSLVLSLHVFKKLNAPSYWVLHYWFRLPSTCAFVLYRTTSTGFLHPLLLLCHQNCSFVTQNCAFEPLN